MKGKFLDSVLKRLTVARDGNGQPIPEMGSIVFWRRILTCAWDELLVALSGISKEGILEASQLS